MSDIVSSYSNLTPPKSLYRSLKNFSLFFNMIEGDVLFFLLGSKIGEQSYFTVIYSFGKLSNFRTKFTFHRKQRRTQYPF